MGLSYSALVLAGGHSSRLGGTPKALLSNGKQTLLASTLAACSGAQVQIVVGPDCLPLPPGTLQTREEPAFTGPAAAISAGLRTLSSLPVPWTLLLSVDLPRAADAIGALVQAAESAREDQQGFWGVSEGIYQPLLGIYRTAALEQAFAGDTAHASVRRFLVGLNPCPVELPAPLTQDVDTWDQARATGFDRPSIPPAS